MNGHDACAWMQAGGRELQFKGMSQQDAQGWSQALATACVLKYAIASLQAVISVHTCTVLHCCHGST